MQSFEADSFVKMFLGFFIDVMIRHPDGYYKKNQKKEQKKLPVKTGSLELYVNIYLLVMRYYNDCSIGL
jgi:hypothetical protein